MGFRVPSMVLLPGAENSLISCVESSTLEDLLGMGHLAWKVGFVGWGRLEGVGGPTPHCSLVILQTREWCHPPSHEQPIRLPFWLNSSRLEKANILFPVEKSSVNESGPVRAFDLDLLVFWIHEPKGKYTSQQGWLETQNRPWFTWSQPQFHREIEVGAGRSK